MSRSHDDGAIQDKKNVSVQTGHEPGYSSSDLRVEDVRAPNIAQRVREELEAIQHTFIEKHERGYKDQNIRKQSPNEHITVRDQTGVTPETLHEKHGNKVPKSQHGDNDEMHIGCWTHMGRTLEKFCGGKAG
ncbi:hypothetical protein KP509_28G051900 [Ceratopteris richardii]|uniref:Uncharacterized protein n=1 Tax=Ceratopteris richardii TaxID=49495 RepID=A0A8T2RC26_CERRI|nr:hypothetical protein KP509_28G051900 [Ceratopteris richardii]